MSVPFSAREAVDWTGGRLRQGPGTARFRGVSIDTRTCAPGDLFLAVRGARYDAHRYLDRALDAGCAGLVVESGAPLPEPAPAELPVIDVADGTRALGALAAGHRRGFDGPVVAVTGSNGKTTTKEMCAAILSNRAPCLRNPGNLNNEFGLPLTLLQRDEKHRTAVVEIGMNHRGEIAPLAAIARPTVGVITCVGTAHIEHLGSIEAIAEEKGELVAALAPDATAVLNADDPRVDAQAARTRARAVRFGRHPGADVRAEDVVSLGPRGWAFQLMAPEGCAPVQLAGLGGHTVSNALAAAAAALAAGASLVDVSAGLAGYRGADGRMQQVALPRNVIVIDDTYNANPQSTEMALRGLADLRGEGRALAVLGDMGELGDTAAAAHRETGRLAATLGIDFLFALGEHGAAIAEGARAAGMDASRIHVGDAHEETSARVREILRGNDWVLVKGSRAMRMERIVQALREGEGAA